MIFIFLPPGAPVIVSRVHCSREGFVFFKSFFSFFFYCCFCNFSVVFFMQNSTLPSLPFSPEDACAR